MMKILSAEIIKQGIKMNPRLLITSIAGSLFLSAIIVFLPTVICEETSGNTLYVGGSGLGNYSRIQDSIDNASSGDTVYVYNGTYYENIVVDKSMNLIGEGKDDTTIDGSVADNVIIITADKVAITGFTIQHSGDVFPKAGINISSDYNVISKNNMTNNFYGITMFHASNNIISENSITNNDHCAIYMSVSSNNNIYDNILKNHAFNGIGVYDSSDSNNITGNTMINNNFCGVNIRISSNNNITGNILTDNNIGIHVPSDKYGNHISDNTFSNNKNDIEKESGMPIFELIIAVLILVCLTVFILFWKEKSHKKTSTSKDTKHYLDARGKPCPIPLIMTKKKITKMKKGEILEIITTDFVAKENLERLGKEKYELIRIDKEGKIFKIYIKK